MSRMAGDQPYPYSPGFKAAGTSQAAARAVAGGKLPARKAALLAAVKNAPGGLTADEAAEATGENVLYARPRITELAVARLLVDTGRTRRNASGLQATVWRHHEQ